MSKHLHDTHFHLDLFNENLFSVAKEIEENKIYTIAVTNLPPLYNKLVKNLKGDYKYIRPALGFHPELIGQYQNLIPKMWEILPQVRYVGEVGLDYKTGNNVKDKQISFFETLIEKCDRQGGKILTIHSRRSSEDVVAIIGSGFNSKFILHWYSGNMSTLKLALKNGAYFSINYAMTKSAFGKKLISNIPIDRWLLESDGPFIKFNEERLTPIHNIHTISNLSRITGFSSEIIMEILGKNFKSLIR
ncbi:TatD family hydrolase [Winogradskyella sediminis]|uniref:TatD family hydrolase n=1 Tax=Winogradskyella sediminis TaxID=1382466 RepID=UPI003AA906AF